MNNIDELTKCQQLLEQITNNIELCEHILEQQKELNKEYRAQLEEHLTKYRPK